MAEGTPVAICVAVGILIGGFEGTAVLVGNFVAVGVLDGTVV